MTPDESRAMGLLAQVDRRFVRTAGTWSRLPEAWKQRGERMFAAAYGRPIEH